MNQNRNYQKEMETHLSAWEKEGKIPKLLLHSCCAPCSSYVLNWLSSHFDIVDFYYNPNIFPETEYRKRVEEIQRLIREMPLSRPVQFVEGTYDPDNFFSAVKGLEDVPEGGDRCAVCFSLRLREAAREALRQHCEYFATTLTISPLKNARLLNTIGEQIGKEEGVAYLPSDFKKKDGYKQSVLLSEKYRLYRQDYCGCIFSKREREQQKKVNAQIE